MDAQLWLQGILLVRSIIDVAKALATLLPQRKILPDTIPVRRLVTKQELLMSRSKRAIIVPRMRWPQ